MPEFEKFPKIPRLNRRCIITEKIDGTNGQVHISEGDCGDYIVRAGSRNRWVTPEDDNQGFAAWVEENLVFLIETLGVGTHYGEWFGQKIGRTYDLEERRFALFNSHRWCGLDAYDEAKKHGLYVVPEICFAQHLTALNDAVVDALAELRQNGSFAVDGYMNPEGIVVFHTAANQLFKVTLEHDEMPKGSHEKVF